MNTGSLRLRRILKPKTGRGLLLSFTAGLEVGVVPGLVDLLDTIGGFAKTGLLTAACVHAGVPARLFAHVPDLPCGVIIDLFGGTWMSTRPDRREQICSLEHAVRVGADAVLATVGLGSADETHHLRLCGQIVRDAGSWGLPVIIRIDATQTDARRQYSATLAGHGARLAYELGADVVVVNYAESGSSFAEMLRGVAIPVLIGGGPSMESDEALVNSITEAMCHGASGVALAAPLFWHDGPSATLTRVAEFVYA
jgi:DhnA family fructose-bisphosphate aldolase class Ia